jgi:WD40 repeat protein
LTILKRYTYTKQVESNIRVITNKVKQIVEVTNDRFITFNFDNKVRLWCSETLNLIKVITSFNGKELNLLNFMHELKNGVICTNYLHFGLKGTSIIHGIWDVDTPEEFKQLFINKIAENYFFRETKNYLIFVKFFKGRSIPMIKKIEEILFYSFEGYKPVKKLFIFETFSEIYAIEDKLVLLQDGVSVRLYDETFELIDEVEMVAEKITCVDKKKFLISVETEKMNIILKLNQ